MRMKQLDALRAFAVGLVFVEHFGGRTLNEFIPIGAGTVGVGCFFTLSGFLITGILLQGFDEHRGSTGVAWRNFYARRLLRLVPAFYAVLLALVLFNIEPIASSWPWHAAYLTNVWIALGHPSNVFWSLAVEEQFYVLWPFAIAFAPRRWLPAFTLGLIGIALLFKGAVLVLGLDTKATSRLLFGSLPLLATGCLVAIVSYRDGRPNTFDWYSGSRAKLFAVAAWLSLAIAVVSWALLGKQSLFRYFTIELLCGIFFAWLVLKAAIGVKGPLSMILDNPVVQYVGQISYGLYLVHNWMPDIVEKLFGAMPKYQAGPIVLTLTFAICMLSWHLYEKPILTLRKYFEKSHLPAPSLPHRKDTLPAT